MDLPPNFRLLVIGLGQEFRGDDAAGLLIARGLRERLGPEVAILEKSGAAGDLLAAWQGTEAVILADAVRGGGPPGRIYRFPVHETALPAEFFPAASTHAWGVAQAVALGRVLGQLPPYLVVYGIEGQDFSFGQKLSPAVARAIPTASRRIRQEIQEFLGQKMNVLAIAKPHFSEYAIPNETNNLFISMSYILHCAQGDHENRFLKWRVSSF